MMRSIIPQHTKNVLWRLPDDSLGNDADLTHRFPLAPGFVRSI
jgi:hypothetical protein